MLISVTCHNTSSTSNLSCTTLQIYLWNPFQNTFSPLGPSSLVCVMLSTSTDSVLTVYGLFMWNLWWKHYIDTELTHKETQFCYKAGERLSPLCRLKVKKSNDFMFDFQRQSCVPLFWHFLQRKLLITQFKNTQVTYKGWNLKSSKSTINVSKTIHLIWVLQKWFRLIPTKLSHFSAKNKAKNKCYFSSRQPVFFAVISKGRSHMII